ncbi:MAG: hypothetical protein ACK520_05835 [Inhella sp.]
MTLPKVQSSRRAGALTLPKVQSTRRAGALSLRAAWLALAGACAASALQAAEVTRQEVLLLQPDAELRERVPSVDAYGDYVNTLRAAWFDTIQAHALPQPSAGFLVLGVRPGQQSRLWLDFRPPLPDALATALRQRTARALPPAVRFGPVLLTLKLSLDGAPWPTQASPEPASWRAAVAIAGEAIDVSDLVQAVWDRPEP